MTGKCERREEVEPEDATVSAPRGMSRDGEKESDSNSAPSTTLTSHAALRKSPITKKKNVEAVALMLSATKYTQISVPRGESSAPAFVAQHALPSSLADPDFPYVPLSRPIAQVLGTPLIEARDSIGDATAVLETVSLPAKVKSSSFASAIEAGKMKS